ncbi:hypothetical protein [Oryza sativa Japonica Group]|uniref:Uncharacterized protein n=1 Tax=Oryza sativa subsp. japonica TaxID=39947 RepID=Q8LR81_ORYSJ|nr:hypothetical protein [Oryza sativa Japonica Group]
MIGFTVISCDRSDRAVYAGDSMPRESICGDGPGVGLVSNRRLTGGKAAVRPARARRSDRRRLHTRQAIFRRLNRVINIGQTDSASAVRPADQLRLDRSTSNLRGPFDRQDRKNIIIVKT